MFTAESLVVTATINHVDLVILAAAATKCSQVNNTDVQGVHVEWRND